VSDEAADLELLVAAAQTRLKEAASHPAIRNDPVKLVLGGISSSLDLMHQLTLRMEQLAGHVRLLSPQAERDLIERVSADASRAVVERAHEAHAEMAQRKARERWLRDLGTLVGAGLLLVLIGFGAGYFWQARKVDALQNTMNGLQRMAYRDGPEYAGQWLGIETYNHIRDVVGKDCKVTVVNGRRRCDTSIWIDPEPAGKE